MQLLISEGVTYNNFSENNGNGIFSYNSIMDNHVNNIPLSLLLQIVSPVRSTRSCYMKCNFATDIDAIKTKIIAPSKAALINEIQQDISDEAH